MKKYHVMLINVQDNTINQITEKSLTLHELKTWSEEFIELNKDQIVNRQILLTIKEVLI